MTSIKQRTIPVHSPKQIAGFTAACKLGRAILDAAHRAIKPGVTTDDIDRVRPPPHGAHVPSSVSVALANNRGLPMQVVHEYTVKNNAYPSPLRYHHFPKSVCTSVNEVVCHGIPDLRELQDGDIVNVDVTCYLDGYHGDLNETFTVGHVDADSKKLVKVPACPLESLAPVG